MAKSDLLKQAIADANAVKETALANAKIALQEAFAPRLERMLATKLTNEIDGEEEIDATGEEALDAAPEADMEMDMDAEDGDDFNWVDNDLSAEVGGSTYDFEVGMAGGEEELGGEELPAEEMPMSDDEMDAEYNEGYDHDDLDLQEIIDEIIESILREEDGMEEEPEVKDDEVAKKEEELAEAYRTVKKLTSIINEVNLLNAKLLYTNKLFRNFELTEAQKMKVIENFDRSVNTREVKLVFTTLAESFSRPVTKKRVVKESYASKATATTAPKKAPILNEGFEQAERWKKLAGLL